MKSIDEIHRRLAMFLSSLYSDEEDKLMYRNFDIVRKSEKALTVKVYSQTLLVPLDMGFLTDITNFCKKYNGYFLIPDKDEIFMYFD